jgi:flagellar hook-associated protein 1 FlgK
MIGELATDGNVYGSIADSLEATVSTIDNNRQQVIGVSSDEELTYMIKYQNAYNASSRFINVVDEMIETLLTSLG